MDLLTSATTSLLASFDLPQPPLNIPEWSSLNLVERAWATLLLNCTEFQLFTWVTFAMLIVVYVAASAPYWIIDTVKPRWARKYKIQPMRYVTPMDTWKCVKRLLFNHFVLALPLAVFNFPLLKARGVESVFPLPQWYDVLARIFLYLCIEDFWFYWGHRFLHTNWGYKNIHHIHHEFDHPIAMASSYAHPLEFLFLGVGTLLGPMLLGGGHLFSIWAWTIVRQTEAIEVHCGYDFPWHLNKILPFYCGPAHHDFHHYSFKQNYASTFTWCDVLFKTDFDYAKFLSTGGHAGIQGKIAGMKDPYADEVKEKKSKKNN